MKQDKRDINWKKVFKAVAIGFMVIVIITVVFYIFINYLMYPSVEFNDTIEIRPL